jgi:transcriptional regulator with XRE-family HTH domain
VKSTPGKTELFLRQRLRELRKKSGLTQEAFAEQARFSYKYYQGIERGQWSNLRLRTLEKLATGYGIGLHELFSPKTPVPKITGKS